MAFLTKINKLFNLLKKLGFEKESKDVYYLYKYSISYEKAMGEVLNSKKTENKIKDYILSFHKTPETSYQELLSNPDILHFIEEEIRFYRDFIVSLVPRDLSDNERGQVVIWLTRVIPVENILSRTLNLEHAKASAGKLETFFHHKMFMSKKDLFQVGSLEELISITEEAAPVIKEYLSKKEYLDAESGKKVIHDGPEFIVYEVHNKGAACELGKGTEWCTAAPGLDYFAEYYSPDSPLFVFINKSDPEERYQFSYLHEEFKDIEDYDVDLSLKNKLTSLILDYLKEVYPLVYLFGADLRDKEKNNIILQSDLDFSGFTFEDLREFILDNGISKEAQSKIFNGLNYFVGKDGTKTYFDDELRYHRTDGPAVEFADGTKAWWVEGKLHRTDGPAVEKADSTKQWHVEGKLHRIDGPAIEDADGTKHWFVDGKLHRTDGPAVEKADSTKYWFKDDRLHRTDGPAVEDADGTKKWYVEGRLHRTDGPAIEWADGIKHWYVEGKRHRTDGPAIEWADGTKQWWVEGKRHRTDGPAVELADGTKEWYVDGKYHRTDGPAVEHADGAKEWWINGTKYSFEEYTKVVTRLNYKDRS